MVGVNYHVELSVPRAGERTGDTQEGFLEEVALCWASKDEYDGDRSQGEQAPHPMQVEAMETMKQNNGRGAQGWVPGEPRGQGRPG